jgi:hypothetical protein
MRDLSPNVSAASSPRAHWRAYLGGIVLGLATLPKVFLLDPIMGRDWPFARAITELGGFLCNPLVGRLQPASCGQDNSFPDDLLFTAGLGMLYAGLLVAMVYAFVIVQARSRKTDFKRFAICLVLGFLFVVAIFLVAHVVCSFGWYCFQSDSHGEGGRVWSLGVFVIVIPILPTLAFWREARP